MNVKESEGGTNRNHSRAILWCPTGASYFSRCPDIPKQNIIAQVAGKERDRTGRVKSKMGLRTQRQILTRAQLDLRTSAGKLFTQIARDITADLGGTDQLSTIEVQLVEAFAGAAVRLNDLNTRALIGHSPPFDLSEFSNAVSSLVRVATRLGTRRRARDVTIPSLRQYLHQHESHDAQHDDNDEAAA